MTAYTAATEEVTDTGPRISDRALAWFLLIAGLIGATAAFVLTVEKINLLTETDYVPSCSFNPVLSCGSIMSTEQAEVFGFPNPLIGIAVFPVVAATGAALLAGARLARWYWLGLQLGVTLGFVFVCWLIFQSMYRIGALCPYCMVVWCVVLPLFWYVSLRNLSSGTLGVGLSRSRLVRTLVDWHALLLSVAFIVPIVLIGVRFWFYWSTLI